MSAWAQVVVFFSSFCFCLLWSAETNINYRFFLAANTIQNAHELSVLALPLNQTLCFEHCCYEAHSTAIVSNGKRRACALISRTEYTECFRHKALSRRTKSTRFWLFRETGSSREGGCRAPVNAQSVHMPLLVYSQLAGGIVSTLQSFPVPIASPTLTTLIPIPRSCEWEPDG